MHLYCFEKLAQLNDNFWDDWWQKPKKERNISAATKNVFKIGNILVSVRPMFHGGEWRATHCQYLEKLPTPTVTLSIQGLDSQDSKGRYYLQMEIG